MTRQAATSKRTSDIQVKLLVDTAERSDVKNRGNPEPDANLDDWWRSHPDAEIAYIAEWRGRRMEPYETLNEAQHQAFEHFGRSREPITIYEIPRPH